MLASPQPSSSPFGRSSPVGVARQPKRPITDHNGLATKNEKQALWIPMLQSASKGKDLSEKQLILLGGTPDLQREFLEQLNPDTSKQNLRSNDRRRQKQNIPISNRFALGYTYHDVLDADQEDVLARLHVHMLANPSAPLGVLLQPLLNSKTVKDSLITILLDWDDPFTWARQLRQWIRLLRKVVLSLDEETKIAMEENMNAWKGRRLGPEAHSSIQQDVVAPPGPGEWDEGLGLPISIVCVRSEKTERLERELGWGDDQFDFLQQWLRTVLLKHGGSLIYTASFEPNNVRTLIHTSLNIQSLLKRDVVKHNVIDRDMIVVPPNWDSWGKIRILREGFDPELISNAWSVEIQDLPEDTLDLTPLKAQTADFETNQSSQNTDLAAPPSSNEATSAVTTFEQSLPNPLLDLTAQSYTQPTTAEITTTFTPFQEFLQTQSVILEKLKVEDAASFERLRERADRSIPSIDSAETSTTPTTNPNPRSGINSGSISPFKAPTASSLAQLDSLGAHRVNVNGIDLDAEEATRRLRERENERNALRRAGSESVTSNGVSGSGTGSPVRPGASRAESGLGTARDDGKPSNEALHGFFANLIKKGEQGRNRGSAVASGTASPRRESPAPAQRREE